VKRAVAISILLVAAGCEPEVPPQDPTNSADPVYRVDLSKCPRTAEWPNLTLANGQLADVTILQLGSTKLYVPMEWLRERGWKSRPRPPSQGVVADTGGKASFDPPLDSRFSAGQFLPIPANCPGIVHVLGQARAQDTQPGPDFNLTLHFERSATGSPENVYSEQLPKLYHHNSISIEFSHDRKADSFDLVKAWTLPEPPQQNRRLEGQDLRYGVNAAGWIETGTNRGGSFSLVNRQGDRLNPSFAARNTLGVVSFPFWATEDIVLTYRLIELQTPPEQWTRYREPLRQLLGWLATPPARRENDRRFSLAPAER
jgi:hypothetical protein